MSEQNDTAFVISMLMNLLNRIGGEFTIDADEYVDMSEIAGVYCTYDEENKDYIIRLGPPETNKGDCNKCDNPKKGLVLLFGGKNEP